MNFDRENFDRISKAIDFIVAHFKEQPDLDQIAATVHLSPFHFQRLFTAWAGVSPKKFLQYISVDYAKRILVEQQVSLFDVAFDTGLSGTGRLHDLFVNIEGMSPGEFKNGGENLAISYSFDDSPFGRIMIASTSKGICHLSFTDEDDSALALLKMEFPKASFHQKQDATQHNALMLFRDDWSSNGKIKLHLKCSAFQLKVWEALLKIPVGGLRTYGKIARSINYPKASRAVGSAIGQNPVAYLIPCHRVIQQSGAFGQYRWGCSRKTAMIGWEASKVNKESIIF